MRRGTMLGLPSGQIHVVDSGGSGRLVLLVHGLGGQHTNWIDVRDGMRRLGHVISIDLPGFGFSPPLERHGLDAFAEIVAETIEHYGGPCLLVGNSMGGLVSEMVAARRPELVEGLALIAPATRAYGARPANITIFTRLAMQSLPGAGTAIANLYRRLLTPEEQAIATLDLVCADPERISSAVRSASIEMATLRRTMPWAVRALAESTGSIRRALLDRRGFDEMIDSISAPTLILSGARDEIVAPGAIAGLASRRADWTWLEHPDLGHVPQMEDPSWALEEIGQWASDVMNPTRSAG